MDGQNTDKKYEPSKIPSRPRAQEPGRGQTLPQVKPEPPAALSDGMYYEIEYEPHAPSGASHTVPPPQKIEAPEKDEIRDLFGQMRDLARAQRSTYAFSRFFDRRVSHDNAAIFYKQGLFMKDFTDDYTGSAPFSQYFPYYQMMGYEQLRTYFTWRTEVRRGRVSDTSLSYAFLYIYELLGNIGVDDPQDGLDKLMVFWKAFGVYNKSIDKYVLRWLKDYHIYYELPQSFHEFIEKNDLTKHYPKMADSDDNFHLFCAISKYDIRKSAFFSEERAKLITDCFYFVTNQLRQVFLENGIHFDESIFQPTKNMSAWTPFQSALFYAWLAQPDRRIVLSEHEIYLCRQNQWTFSTAITTESGKQLIGYVVKQMESVLRSETGYKFKLSANLNTVTHEAVGKLREAGISLDATITNATIAFYRETTKTVVAVNPEALSIIRREAFATQEKLIVAEREEQLSPVLAPLNLSFAEAVSACPSARVPISDTWGHLGSNLTETEKEALSVVLRGETELKKFADGCGVMLEVLADGINEKAMDHIGDNLLDEAFALYDEYREQVEELIR